MTTHRKVLAAALAVTALTGCHGHDTPHAQKASSPANNPESSAPARAALDSIPTRPETAVSGYSHTGWSRHGGCDTRGSFLQEHDVHHAAHIKKGTRCTVNRGNWVDSYSGRPLNGAPKGLVDVDHMVPLAEAWQSGAAQWSPRLWEQFVNDQQHGELVIANASLNRSKGDKSPDQWLPPADHAKQCHYARQYVQTAAHWNQQAHREGHELSMDAGEKAGITRILDGCKEKSQ